MKIQYHILNEEDYRRKLGLCIVENNPVNEIERELIRIRIFEVRSVIENFLANKWVKNEDFEVGWDYTDYSFYRYGGIYSEKIFCTDYVQTIIAALDKIPDGNDWVYHTVCEIVVNPNGTTIAESTEYRGEFFIHNRSVNILKDEMSKSIE
ncbi:MAG: hypothetical protein HC887_04570 [Desulfobacteraceae bacterium]|nr:hypothetical protein [Desulfobacteraceae bacterium]